MYTKIKLGTIEKEKLQCVFLLIYCKDGIPYRKYSVQDGRFLIPKILSLGRHDGFVGFIGGKVDPGETLKDALIREVEEETGLILDQTLPILPLATFSEKGANIHSFKLEVTNKELLAMTSTIVNSEKFGIEITGFNLNHIEHYKNNGGINEVLNQNWKATGRLELDELIKTENLL